MCEGHEGRDHFTEVGARREVRVSILSSLITLEGAAELGLLSADTHAVLRTVASGG